MNVNGHADCKAKLAALVEAGGDVVDDAYPVAHGDAHCRVSQALIDTLRTALAAARTAPAQERNRELQAEARLAALVEAGERVVNDYKPLAMNSAISMVGTDLLDALAAVLAAAREEATTVTREATVEEVLARISGADPSYGYSPRQLVATLARLYLLIPREFAPTPAQATCKHEAWYESLDRSRRCADCREVLPTEQATCGTCGGTGRVETCAPVTMTEVPVVRREACPACGGAR